MTTIQDGSDLRQMAYSGLDMDAVEIICDVTNRVRMDSLEIIDVKDIAQRGSIRANLENIQKAIDMGKLPDMMAHFQAAADLQEEYWATTEHKKEIIPEFPHHENIIWSDQDNQWNSKSGLVNAPLSYIFGPIVSNPHSFDKSVQENIDFVTAPGRISEIAGYLSTQYQIPVQEILMAGSIYCDTVVGKRAWSIANKGDIEPGQVGPESFIAIGNAIRAEMGPR